MKTRKPLLSFILTLILAFTLCGCSSDYPVVDRQLDVSDLITTCFEGSGYTISLPEQENVTVSAVADRMTIDFDKSADTISEIQSAVRQATASEDGLTGTWKAQVDISPLLCEVFSDLDGMEMEDYLNHIVLAGELTFTNSGIYTLHFSKEEVASAREQLSEKAYAATKGYLSSRSGLEKTVVDLLPDQDFSAIEYIIRLAMLSIENGSNGTYYANNATLSFGENGTCTYQLSGNTLTLSNADCSGMLQIFNGKTTIFTLA